MTIPNQTKKCNKCGEIKNLTEFGDRHTNKDGKHGACLSCSRQDTYKRRQAAKGQPLTAQDIERFWAKVNKGEPNACWEWQGSRSKSGHGRFGKAGTPLLVHRIAYELANGPIPEGLLVIHSCFNAPCCNPAHLRVGTYHDNNMDTAISGRHWAQKLTPEDVIEIRRLEKEGVNTHDIAKQFGIKEGTVRDIAVYKRSWTWLK